MVDALLNSILDYSLYKPGTVAARYCVSANPNMQAGLATAVLSVGEYTLAPEDAGRFIIESHAALKKSGQDTETYAKTFVAQLRASRKRVPGFGHPNFKFVDPRSQKLKEIAQREGVWGEYGEWYEAVHRAFCASTGKSDIPINDVGMAAALLAQLGFTPQEMTGIALMSSLPGVIAHISEELATNIRIRVIPDSTASYPRHRRNLDADLAAAGWPASQDC
jgi:citrate synthase